MPSVTEAKEETQNDHEESKEFVVVLSFRISPTEWAEPHKEEHSFTLLHSFWYITGALTLQGNTGVCETETHTAAAGCRFMCPLRIKHAALQPYYCAVCYSVSQHNLSVQNSKVALTL